MTKLALPVRKQDHVLGPMNAPVTLVEYGDFECPYCGQAHPIVKRILEEMGSDVLFVFRHFPISSVHPHAEAAALAAESAGAQGRFWEMHDLLFENQRALEDVEILQYAEALDLDMVAFVEPMKIGKYLPRIKEDFMSGVRSGVNGTPTFFINGARHDSSYDFPVLTRALREAALARTR